MDEGQVANANKVKEVEWRVEGRTIYLIGCIKEVFSLEIAKSLFDQIEAGTKPIQLDLSQVQYMNSMGILSLSRAMAGQTGLIELVGIPETLVNVMNCSTVFPSNVKLVSFYAPFRNEEDDEISYRLLHIGSDIPLLDDYETYDVSKLPKMEGYQPAFTPQDYFGFLEEYCETVKE